MNVEFYATLSVVLTPEGPGDFITVGDVRTWLRHVDSLGIGDDAVCDEALLAVDFRTDTITAGDRRGDVLVQVPQADDPWAVAS